MIRSVHGQRDAPLDGVAAALTVREYQREQRIAAEEHLGIILLRLEGLA